MGDHIGRFRIVFPHAMKVKIEGQRSTVVKVIDVLQPSLVNDQYVTC